MSRTYSPSKSYSSGSADSEIIHFEWFRGQNLDKGRYDVRGQLGDGTFGRVLRCVDNKYKDTVAIKVIRDVPRYVENALIEAKILKRLFEESRQSNRSHRSEAIGRENVVRLFDTFFHRSKIFCLVFEPLGHSLYDLLKKNDYVGMYASDIQLIAEDCLRGLAFCHSRSLIHTDIKAENILFVSDRSETTSAPARFTKKNRAVYHRPVFHSRGAVIKLIDFGNGIFPGDRRPSVICTRQYRAPEVLLEQPWDEAADVWSMACVFAELYTGDLLFQTHEDHEHLALIEKTLKPLPQELLQSTPRSVRKQLLTESNDGSLFIDFPPPDYPVDETSVKKVRDAKSLKDIFKRHPDLGVLMGDMLKLNARDRATCREALEADFFRRRVSE